MSGDSRQLGGVDICVAAGESSPPIAATREPALFEGQSPGSPFGAAGELSSARGRVLDAARRLFCSLGYEHTPLRAISDSLGMTRAAVYYHFRAKEDLLVAIVTPMLDRIDEVVDSAGPGVVSPPQRREFMASYVEELARDGGIIALLYRDPVVREHPVGQRFADQHLRMRALLGAVDEPASAIRTTIALRALETAVVEFGDVDPAQLRETALNIAVAVLDSDAGVRLTSLKRPRPRASN